PSRLRSVRGARPAPRSGEAPRHGGGSVARLRVGLGRRAPLARGDRALRARPVRGIAGAFERSWSGAPGTVPWTKTLMHLEHVYAAVSSSARRRAASTRRRLPDCRVLAVGNLTVGGTGKSTIARWLALEALRAGRTPAV